MFDYFKCLAKPVEDNDFSLYAHAAIVRFLIAAHVTMLHWLKNAPENCKDGTQLIKWWHAIMEPDFDRTDRGRFFTEVLEKAKNVRQPISYVTDSEFK